MSQKKRKTFLASHSLLIIFCNNFNPHPSSQPSPLPPLNNFWEVECSLWTSVWSRFRFVELLIVSVSSQSLLYIFFCFVHFQFDFFISLFPPFFTFCTISISLFNYILPISVSVLLFIFLFLFVCLFILLASYPAVHLSVFLSIYLSIC